MNPTSLLGLHKNSEKITEFLISLQHEQGEDTQNTPAPSSSKSFKDATYINYSSLGVSLQYVEGKVDCVHIYNEGEDGYTKYKGECTKGLSLDTNAKEIVELLGEPTKKGGGNHRDKAWLAYDPLGEIGIQINLFATDWDTPECNIASIAIYQA